jgi:hypothetical protein
VILAATWLKGRVLRSSFAAVACRTGESRKTKNLEANGVDPEEWHQKQAEAKRQAAAEEDAVMEASGLTFTGERLTASTAAGSFVGTYAEAQEHGMKVGDISEVMPGRRFLVLSVVFHYYDRWDGLPPDVSPDVRAPWNFTVRLAEIAPDGESPDQQQEI